MMIGFGLGVLVAAHALAWVGSWLLRRHVARARDAAEFDAHLAGRSVPPADCLDVLTESGAIKPPA